MEKSGNHNMVNMKPDDKIAATLTRQEWSIVVAGLGELPGKVMFELTTKIGELLKATPDAPLDPDS